ncbi:ArsR/SmtB family transcription factor [Flexivirga alba]|uniref:ArsR/SmtB family transcription factor n=1 Tax=Flexivirga alba TaxID=702742 RepID=A0ABW2AEN5_9MICO
MDAVLQALADPSRRTVLEILRDHEATAGELADALPIARPGVSRHLRVLRRPAWSTFVTRRNDGSMRCVRKRLCQLMIGWRTTEPSGRTASTHCIPKSPEGRRPASENHCHDTKAQRNERCGPCRRRL